MLYKKLEDPEQCKYSLFYPETKSASGGERQKKSGPGLGICSRQSTCSSLTSSSDSSSVNRGHCSPAYARSSPMIDGGRQPALWSQLTWESTREAIPMISAASKFLDAANLTRTAPQNRWQRLGSPPPSPPAIPRHPPPPSPPAQRLGSPPPSPPAPLPAWQGDTNVGDAHGGGGLARRNPQAPTRRQSPRPLRPGGGVRPQQQQGAQQRGGSGAPARRASSEGPKG